MFIRLGEFTTLNAFQCGKARVTSGIINETKLTKNEKAPLNVLIQWGLRCVRHEKQDKVYRGNGATAETVCPNLRMLQSLLCQLR